MTEELKPIDRRKATKPIMEKRRRARINNSLNELKVLILEALKRDTSCYSKLEKADILEMTVQHLRGLKNRRINDVQSNSLTLANYRAGFNECASEITRVLMSLEGADLQVRAKLLNYLATCCHRNTSPEFLSSSTPAPTGFQRASTQQVDIPTQSTVPPTSPTSLTFKPIENFAAGMSQYQLVPAFTNGQLAAILVPTMESLSCGVPQLSGGLFPVLYGNPKDSLSKKELELSRQPVKLESERVWRPF